MDPLLLELAKLQRDGNLKQSIEDVDKIIEQLEKARETIVAGKEPISFESAAVASEACLIVTIADLPDPNSASITLAKLQNPLKHGFDKVNDDLKKVHRGHNAYSKALDKVGDHKA
jgi:E3 ubiquitin-protein transferase RMND5